MGKVDIRDVYRWGGCSVVGFPPTALQVSVERVGPESPLPLIYSMQEGFLWEGRFLKPFGGGRETGWGKWVSTRMWGCEYK